MNGLMWIKSPSIDTVPNFKKEIHLKKKLKKATLSVSSMGFYRAYINDISVTSNVFMPGWTSYLNRVQYQVYDVTKLLSDNSMLSILLAEGWGGAKRIAWPSKEYPYFEPSLIFK